MTTVDEYYTALIIDDEGSFREWFRDEVEALIGLRPASFKSFAMLLKYIYDPENEDQNFVVFVDWNLLPGSGMSGPDLVRYIRKNLAHRVVCYVLTGSPDKDVELQAMAAGAKHYFQKGVLEEKPEDLADWWLTRVLKFTRKEIVDQLLTHDEHDDMVGLPNFRGFCNKAVEELNSARRAYHDFREAGSFRNQRKTPQSSVLVCMDIDHFKSINDNNNHLKGDEAIITFAQTLKAHVRDRDVLARYHGDEFLVLICGADRVRAGQAVDHLQAELAKVDSLIGHDSKIIKLSMTCGFAEIPHEEIIHAPTTLANAIKVADDDLLAKKRAREPALRGAD